MGTLIGNLLGKLPSNLLRQIFKLDFPSSPLPPCTGTQALVRPGSPHSSISAEDRTSLATICKAKALVDSLPNPYDKEALKFKVSTLRLTTVHALIPPFPSAEGRTHRCAVDECIGHLEGTLSRPCGTLQVHQRGSVAGGAAHEELKQQNIGARWLGETGQQQWRWQQHQQQRRQRQHQQRTQLCGGSADAHRSQGIHLGVCAQRVSGVDETNFTTNFLLDCFTYRSICSYEDLELFKELEPADLDYLGILNQEHRAKLLTAVQLLHDIECEYQSKNLPLSPSVT